MIAITDFPHQSIGKYVTVKATTTEDLDVEVKIRLDEGYQPYGPQYYHAGLCCFIQPVVMIMKRNY